LLWAFFGRLRLLFAVFCVFGLFAHRLRGGYTSIGGPFGVGMYISARSVLVVDAFWSFAPSFCSFLCFLLDYASFSGRVGAFADDKIRLFGCSSLH